MIDLHPEIFVKDGKRLVILPYEEFAAIQQALADAEDLAALRTAKEEEGDANSISLDRVLKDLELSS